MPLGKDFRIHSELTRLYGKARKALVAIRRVANQRAVKVRSARVAAQQLGRWRMTGAVQLGSAPTTSRTDGTSS